MHRHCMSSEMYEAEQYLQGTIVIRCAVGLFTVRRPDPSSQTSLSTERGGHRVTRDSISLARYRTEHKDGLYSPVRE